MVRSAPYSSSKSLAENVRAGVPVELLALRIVEGEELERAVALEGAAHVPVGAVDVGEERGLRELLVDAHGDVPGRGDELDSLLDGAVGHNHLDGLVLGLGRFQLFALAREVLLEQLDALGIERRLLLVRGRPLRLLKSLRGGRFCVGHGARVARSVQCGLSARARDRKANREGGA